MPCSTIRKQFPSKPNYVLYFSYDFHCMWPTLCSLDLKLKGKVYVSSLLSLTACSAIEVLTNIFRIEVVASPKLHKNSKSGLQIVTNCPRLPIAKPCGDFSTELDHP